MLISQLTAPLKESSQKPPPHFHFYLFGQTETQGSREMHFFVCTRSPLK